MKKTLTYLLILWSLVLCGFVAFQWLREARLRADVQKLALDGRSKAEAISNLEGTIKTLQNEISRLDTLKQELTSGADSNRQEVAQMRSELRAFLNEKQNLSQQVETYKTALGKANANIQEQNENLKKQNEALKLLAEQRNSAVAKQNEVIQQYNDLVKKFNDAQEMLSKVNSGTAK